MRTLVEDIQRKRMFDEEDVLSALVGGAIGAVDMVLLKSASWRLRDKQGTEKEPLPAMIL